MTSEVPKEVTQQHIAILGKTGSGKSSTAKLIVEQVVATGARVCVLDPIKSDWWGLTSSADGKRAGLPFHILGGPHGHVPLHASAGKVIADIVANGSLPLSIIDMADFEPGGQAKFFVDFAPALLRKMRGVVYLVIEEAHLFAPKERSGIGAENLSIHWAKTLATAGRSKGVRLVLVSQRTQALHNALLGSCDTLIAHRLTAPADQEPVVKWLKANTSKEVLDQVAGSLSSLKTGEGWVCSGEARIFSRLHFSRIATYDNTATPTGDGEAREIKTAAVDRDKLTSLIGTAVDQAKADDPKELKKTIAEKDRRIRELERATPVSAEIKSAPAKTVEILTDADRALLKQVVETRAAAAAEDGQALLERCRVDIVDAVVALIAGSAQGAEDARSDFLKKVESARFQKILDKLDRMTVPQNTPQVRPGQSRPLPAAQPGRTSVATRPAGERSGDAGDIATGVRLKVLNALAELETLSVASPSREIVAFLSGYSNPKSAGFVASLGALSVAALIAYPSPGAVQLTEAGRGAAEYPTQPSSPDEVQQRVVSLLGGKAGEMLKPLIAAYPKSIERAELAAAVGYGNPKSAGFVAMVGRLSTLGFARYPSPGTIAAAPVLFLEA